MELDPYWQTLATTSLLLSLKHRLTYATRLKIRTAALSPRDSKSWETISRKGGEETERGGDREPFFHFSPKMIFPLSRLNGIEFDFDVANGVVRPS